MDTKRQLRLVVGQLETVKEYLDYALKLYHDLPTEERQKVSELMDFPLNEIENKIDSFRLAVIERNNRIKV